MQLLFETPHGSHLYGPAHAESDRDNFEVYTNRPDRSRARYARQSINGSEDVLVTDLSTFLQYASKGVPQYLEAMYSRMSRVDTLGAFYRLRFKPHTAQACSTYRRTIRSFYARAEEESNPKFARHAWRLGLNLIQIEQGNAFNPTLTAQELVYINSNLERLPYGYSD